MTALRFGQMSRRRLLAGGAQVAAWVATCPAFARDRPAFALIAAGIPADILMDAICDSAVGHVARAFAGDLERVAGTAPRLITDPAAAHGPLVVIGVAGASPIIDALIAAGKVHIDPIRNVWEAFCQTVVERPFPGVARALVIVGADRRGAVFGTYDISERIGVSPWHWFADVPVARRHDVAIPAETRHDWPRVRYRGFFINDEDPCFSGWAQRAFGGVNAAVYAQVFELLLRMKGNYLWPAMWGKAFAVDDPASQPLADAMGVVMGSSHHEVMMRAQQEWHMPDPAGHTGGAWDYARNGANLRAFWRGGIARMMSRAGGGGYESVVTIGMRGDGDEAMAEAAAIPLLEEIVAAQRAIIADVTRRPADETPQVWALYKEVQDYYDHGMRVPDDVTLLFSDDNWGQIRRLPAQGTPVRRGGYGIYYHFDYVGVPRNYKWINTNRIEKIWQQMDLAYVRGARAMWIANVGDIKPMEFPLGFFLAMAWNPEAMTPAALARYPQDWASATFGPAHAAEIGDIVATYGQYAARRKPELLDSTSFPLGEVRPDTLDGGAFGAIVAQWDALEARMSAVRAALPVAARDAYDQLVGFPVAALANLYRLYNAVAWNRALGILNDVRANAFADRAEAAFARDRALTAHYHALNGGKWDGMMAQVHIGYVIWNDPTQQTMPGIVRVGGVGAMSPAPVFAPDQAAEPRIHSIAAAQFRRASASGDLAWTTVPRLGADGAAMVVTPQGRPATTHATPMFLEYDIDIAHGGPLRIAIELVPTLNVDGGGGLRTGVSIDDGPVTVLTASLTPTSGTPETDGSRAWTAAVIDNVVRLDASLGAVAVGRHVIRVWRIDGNVVWQKLIVTESGGAAAAT